MKRLGLIMILLLVFGCVAEETEVQEEDKWTVSEGDIPALTRNATAVLIEAPNCPNCDYADYILYSVQTEELGTDIIDVTRLSHNSTEAKLLIDRYGIEKLPALILNKDTEWDHRILSLWSAQMGTFENDNALILRDVFPPYYDLETEEFKGFVEIKLVVNKSCTECYDVNAFANDMISTFKFVAEKQEIDAESETGQELIAKYNITQIPTYIINEDALEYPDFEDFWVSKGNTKEGDGWMVFRAVDQLGANYITLNG